MIKKVVVIALAICVSACSSGPQVKRIQTVSDTADNPYSNVLVIALFKSFDARRYLEKDIVQQLSERGVNAIASTSLMDTKTPVTRETFIAMVEAQGSDSVLVTQLVSAESGVKLKDARPKSTYIVRPTYYFNVWDVQLTEFVAQPTMQLNHDIILATQLYSVAMKKAVWAIESNTKLKVNFNERGDQAPIRAEAKAVATYLSRDGLLATN